MPDDRLRVVACPRAAFRACRRRLADHHCLDPGTHLAPPQIQAESARDGDDRIARNGRLHATDPAARALARRAPLAAALGLVLCACSAPLVPYSADTPPLLLAPTSLAGVQDKRARFREIYCAVLQERGRELPDYRPCEDALTRVGAEPAGTGKPVDLGRQTPPRRWHPRRRVRALKRGATARHRQRTCASSGTTVGQGARVEQREQRARSRRPHGRMPAGLPRRASFSRLFERRARHSGGGCVPGDPHRTRGGGLAGRRGRPHRSRATNNLTPSAPAFRGQCAPAMGVWTVWGRQRKAWLARTAAAARYFVAVPGAPASRRFSSRVG